MSSQLKEIYTWAVFFVLSFGVVSGADRVLAADVTISPNDLMSTKADPDATPPVLAKSAQQKVMEKIKGVGAGDTVMFPSGSYDDVGEILITSGGEPSDDLTTEADEGDGPVVFQGNGTTFTGKIMFNVKAGHVVIRGFTFMDTEVPDAVTIRADNPGTSGTDESIRYGFPGVTVGAFLKKKINTYTGGANPSDSNVDYSAEMANNAELWVTVAAGDDAGSIANKGNGDEVTGASTDDYDIWGEGITSAKAKDGIGTVWVDSVIHSGTCRMSADSTPMDIQIAGVVIRNNMFSNTEVAAVRAGDHSPIQGVAQCMPQVDVIGNTFMNIGGKGPFVTRPGSETASLADASGNKIADIGNREPAIDLRKVRASRVTDNTIGDDGTSVPPGTSDAIVVMNAPAKAAISIENNRITNPMLNGILIVDNVDGVRTLAADAASITVSGNVISGVNANRYLTAPYTSNGYDADANPAEDDGTTDPVLQSYTSERDADCYDRALEADPFNLILAPEVWRSRVTSFPFTQLGAPRSLVNSSGAVVPPVAGNIGNTDLIRYKADQCLNLGSVKVVSQEGVSITNNDLGYVADGEFSLDSLDYGLVVEGTSTTLSAFRGNNIDFYSVTAVFSTATKAVAVAGNYLGERPVPSDKITGDAEGAPIAATDDAPRGPRGNVVNPDMIPPTIRGAALNAERTMLIITYSENLNSDSDDVADLFTVIVRDSASDTRPAVINVSNASVDGDTVTLTLASSPKIEAGNVVTVTYDAPSPSSTADKVQDRSGNRAASIARQTVVNPADSIDPGGPAGPATSSSDGGCALASAGSFAGVDLGMLLPLMAAAFVFGIRRKTGKN